MPLKHVDPSRRPGLARRWYAALAATRLARFVSRHISWKLDPWLLRATGGRVASTLMFPTAVLETTGAKTGAPRRNAIIYFHDGDDIIAVASNAGAPHNPSWYANLRAHPNALFGGEAVHATTVDDESERTRLFALADNVFPTFANYRREAARTGRTIPVVRLIPS